MKFDATYATLLKTVETLGSELLDTLAADETNAIAVSHVADYNERVDHYRPRRKAPATVSFFAHLRDWHGWSGISWYYYNETDSIGRAHDEAHTRDRARTTREDIEDGWDSSFDVGHVHP